MWNNREMLDLGPWNELAAPRGEFTTLLRGLALDYNQLGSPEPEFLFSLSYRTTGRGAIVELGTFIGTSLLALSLAQKLKGSSRPITTIDVKRRLELDENLAKAGLANAVNVVLSDSLAAAASWREPIELLWIDADRGYKGCLADIEAWKRHVLPGGLIALHDFADGMGVYRAVHEGLLSRPWAYRVVSDREYGNIFVVEKLADEGAVPAWEDRLSHGEARPESSLSKPRSRVSTVLSRFRSRSH